MATKVRLTTRDSFFKFADVLRARQDFSTAGALRGEAGPAVYVGRLAPEYRDSARNADYVVYSYDTPIAWFLPFDSEDSFGSKTPLPSGLHGCLAGQWEHKFNFQKDGFEGWWVVPDESYSVTTSRHQGKIRTAISVLKG